MIKSLHNCIPGLESNKSKLDGCPFSATTAFLLMIDYISDRASMKAMREWKPRDPSPGFQDVYEKVSAGMTVAESIVENAQECGVEKDVVITAILKRIADDESNWINAEYMGETYNKIKDAVKEAYVRGGKSG